jgi:hypothetical protein
MSGGSHYFWLGASADADPALVASDQAATRLASSSVDPLRGAIERMEQTISLIGSYPWGDRWNIIVNRTDLRTIVAAAKAHA